jgi:hypothetical protein
LDQDSPLIDADPLIAALLPQGISETQIMETQEVLNSRGHIQLHATMGPPHVDALSVLPAGFDHYTRAAIPNFNDICTDVVRMLIRKESMSHRGIAQDFPSTLVRPPALRAPFLTVRCASSGLPASRSGTGHKPGGTNPATGYNYEPCWIR